MTPERFQQIDQLVTLALDRDAPQRRALLDEACGEDEALRREVESLLSSNQQAGEFLVDPPSDVAADMLSERSSETGERHPEKIRSGSSLGRYRIQEKLGVGGMGQVYMAYDPELNRNVAIKLMRPETSLSSDASQ